MNTIKCTALAAGLAATFTGFGAYAGPAPDHCYDFSKLAEDASFTVGDVIDTDFATITIKPYFVDGNEVTADARHADRVSSQIAGGDSPELEMYLVALSIEPKKPVSKISTQIAQNISSTGGFANSGIGVNKKGLKSLTGFAGMDGKVLGRKSTGMAKISANLAPVGGGNWHRGTLELNAVQGKIEILRLAGHSVKIDNFCLTY